MRILTAIAAGAALLTTTNPAIAQDQDETQVIEIVNFGDLDLSIPADLGKLKQRISGATEAVCGSYANADYIEWDAIGRCRVSVRQSVEPQIARAINSATARYAKR